MSDLKNVSLSGGREVNAMAKQWGFERLPSNLTFVNGSLEDAVNGTINGTTIVEILSTTNVGSISLTSFIYIIISCLVFVMMVPGSVRWIRAARTQHHRFIPSVTRADFPERQFLQQVRRHYPAAPAVRPVSSYAEAVDHIPSGLVSAEELRKGRALLRAKYALECDVLNYRHVFQANQHIVDKKRRQADGAQHELGRLVYHWLQARHQWSAEEWELVVKISQMIPHVEVEQPGQNNQQ